VIPAVNPPIINDAEMIDLAAFLFSPKPKGEKLDF